VTAHVTERLSAYLDGEVPPSEREEIALHLRGCEACAAHLEELLAVDALARDLPVSAPDGYFDALPGRVRARLPFRKSRRARIVPVWSWAVAAALLLAVVAPRVLQQAPRSAVEVKDEMRPMEATRTVAPPAQAQAQAREAPAPAAVPPLLRAASPAASPGAPAPLVAASADALRDEAPKRARLDALAQPAPSASSASSGGRAETERQVAPPGRDQGFGESRAKQEGGAVPEDKAARAPAAKPAFAPPPPEPEVEESAKSRFHADEPAKEPLEADAPMPATAGKDDGGRAANAVGGLTAAGATSIEERLAKKTKARPAGEWYPALMARTARTAKDAAEARALREEWRAFAVHYPSGPRGDEARVRVVEAGLVAFRLSNDPADKSLARQDGESYLRRDDATQGQRVRALLDTAGN
jgi:anti-sigma factor RsiW